MTRIRIRRWLWPIALWFGAAGCAEPELASETQDVKVDTGTDLALAQFRANRDFALAYAPRCTPTSDRPRVLVTGFGRFKSQTVNATGLIVAGLLADLDYPHTEPPGAGMVDDPAPQTAVASGLLTLPQHGEVEICAMVLPVFWDLAAYLVMREAEAFAPDLVVMNGVAGSRQPLWLELGAVNRASKQRDGSDVLMPSEADAPLVPESDELARGNLASWRELRDAAESSLAVLASDDDSLGEVLTGVRFAGYPRSGNTYLCNNTTFTVGYALDHPGAAITLHQASDIPDDEIGALSLQPSFDGRAVPRWFMHWPSALSGDQLMAGTHLLTDIIDAQLEASQRGELPSRGDNELAEVW